MRKIMFRGQTRKRGQKVWMDGSPVDGNWVYGGVFPGKGDYSIIYTYDPIDKFPVYSETVGQFTGLVDKNGAKIFEGDVVKFSYMFENDCCYTVKFMEGYYDSGVYPFLGWCLVNENGEYKKVLVQWSIEEYGLEVIGNIHDNPELLEVVQ